MKVSKGSEIHVILFWRSSKTEGELGIEAEGSEVVSRLRSM